MVTAVLLAFLTATSVRANDKESFERMEAARAVVSVVLHDESIAADVDLLDPRGQDALVAWMTERYAYALKIASFATSFMATDTATLPPSTAAKLELEFARQDGCVHVETSLTLEAVHSRRLRLFSCPDGTARSIPGEN